MRTRSISAISTAIFGYPFADQANGGSIRGMITRDRHDREDCRSRYDAHHGSRTLVKKADLLPYRAMVVNILAKTKELVDQGKSLDDILAANLTLRMTRRRRVTRQRAKAGSSPKCMTR